MSTRPGLIALLSTFTSLFFPTQEPRKEPVWSCYNQVDLCAVLEVLVVFFQVCGIMGLCLSRLMPRSAWSYRGKIGFIVALFGLGIAGALAAGTTRSLPSSPAGP